MIFFTQIRNIVTVGLLSGVFLITPALIHAQKITTLSAKSGPWTDRNTWENGVVPQSGATVVIKSGHQVTLDKTASPATLAINAGGVLYLTDNAVLNANEVTVKGSLEAPEALVNPEMGLKAGSLTILNGGLFDNHAGNPTTISVSGLFDIQDGATYQRVFSNRNGAGENVEDFPGLMRSFSTESKITVLKAANNGGAQAMTISCPSPVKNGTTDGGSCVSLETIFKPSGVSGELTWDATNGVGLSDFGSVVAANFPANVGSGPTLGKTTVTFYEDGTPICTVVVTITDNQAPVFSGCPANITTNIATACTTVTWTPPTVTENCAYTLSANYNSGATFNPGATAVNYIATDIAGSTASCHFTVTVNSSNPLGISFSGATSICQGATGTVTATTTGGSIPYLSHIWTSSNPLVAAVSGTSAEPSVATITSGIAGTATITYAVIDNLGCSKSQSFVMTVNATPVGSNGTLGICSGASLNVDLQNQITNSVASDFTWTVVDNPNLTGEANGNGDFITQSLTNATLVSQSVVYNITPTAETGGCAGASFTYTVAVEDLLTPVVTAPTTIDIECGNVVPSGATDYAGLVNLGGTASDNCTPSGSLVITYSDGSLNGTNCSGTIARTYTVADAVGNVTTVTQTITVSDNTKPTWTTAAGALDVTLQCSDASGLATAQAAIPVSSDNCDVTLTPVKTAGLFVAGITCPQAGTYTNTWTVTDDCGNEVAAPFTQVITIIDNTKPTWTTIAGTLDATVQCSDASGLATAQAAVPVVSDNCDVTLTPVKTAGLFVAGNTCPQAGTYTNTWTVTDDCGNEVAAPFTQVITIIDNTKPTWTTAAGALDVTLQCSDASGLATAQAAVPVVSDNCDVTLTPVKTAGLFVAGNTCPQAGTYTNTWTVTDDCGNEVPAPFTQVITIIDNTKPTWTTAAGALDVTLQCSDASGLATAQAAVPVVSDNCDVTLTPVKTAGLFVAGITCPQAGTYTNTWTVTDDCGNEVAAPFTQVITIIDNTKPTWTTAAGALDVTLQCSDASGLATAQAAVPVVSDNCDVTLTPVKTTGSFVAGNTCPQAGTYTNTWTVTDDCGNEVAAPFTQVITIIDNTKPTWTTAAGALDVTLQCSDASGLATAQAAVPVVSDNCDVTLTPVKTAGSFVAGSCPQAGTYTNTWTVTDDCGNEVAAPFTQVITIIDNTKPTWTTAAGALDVTLQCSDASGLATAQAAVPVVSDNCDVTLTPVKTAGLFVAGNTCPQAGTYTNTWTVTDDCGNEVAAPFTQVITIIDNTKPTWTTAAGALDATVQCSDASGLATAQAAGPVASDNCDVTLTPVKTAGSFVAGSCPQAGTYTNTWTVTDDCGNEVAAPFTQVITIIDNTKPTWTTAAGALDVTLQCSDASGLATAQAAVPVSSDNCDVTLTPVKTAGSFVAGSCPQAGAYTNTWTVTDDCGNEVAAPFTQVITIIDNTKPTWTTIAGALDATVQCSDASGLATAQAAVPVSSDNCDVTLTPVKTAGLFVAGNTCPQAGTYTNTWTVTDDCGNEVAAPFTQVITIIDNTKPTWTTAAGALDATVQCSDASGLATAQAAVPVVSDNCDVTLTPVKTAGSFVAGSCPQAGTYTNTWTVTDDCGNEVAAPFTQVITIIDNTKPTWTTAAGSLDVTVQCSDASGLATAQAAAPVASDNCDVTLTPVKTAGSFVAGSCPQAGTYTNTWTVTDDCGNEVAAPFTQVITIIDNTKPTWTTAAGSLDVTLQCSDASGLATAQAAVPVASDNCDVTLTPVKTAGSFVAGSCPQAGTYTNTWTVTDDCGNEVAAPFTQVITIIDNTKPTWTTAAGALNVTVQCSDASGIAAAQAMIPVAVDNCDGDVTNIVKTAGAFVVGSCPNEGTYTNTWVVTDDCGNTSAVYTQVITIFDNTAPTLTGAPYAGTTGTNACMANAATAAPFSAANAIQGYSDNCAGSVTATLTGTAVTGTDCAWSVTYTFSVKDVCNNTLASQTYSNTGSDQTAPTLTGTPYAGTTGTNACIANAATAAPFSAANAIQGYSDNCAGAVTATLTGTAVTGTNCNWTVTYTFSIKDVCNNTLANQTYSNTGSDQTAPVANLTGYTLGNLDGQNGWNGGIGGFTNYSAGDADVVNTVVKNGTQSWYFKKGYNSPGQGSPFSPAVASVGAPGNGAAGNQSVIKLSFKPAALNDGSRITVYEGSVNRDDRTGANLYVQNLPGNLVQLYMFRSDNDGPMNDYTNQEIIGTYPANVWNTVEMVTDYPATNQLDRTTWGTTKYYVNGTLAFTETTWPHWWRFNHSLAYAPGSSIKFTNNNAGAGFYIDDVSMIVNNTISNTTVAGFASGFEPSALPDVLGECCATIPFPPTATDNCAGLITGTTTDPLTYCTQGTHVVTWTYNDGCGNISTQTQNVIIDDNTAPALTGVPYAGTTGTNACMVNAAASAPFSAANAIEGYTDNCGGAVTATLTNTNVSGTDCSWTVTYTFKVTDVNGNELLGQTYSNTGSDQTAPTLTGISYAGTTGTNACMTNAAAAAPFSAANAIQGYTDNCGGAVTATLTNTSVTGTDCAWTVTYTFSVKDVCDNTLSSQTYSNTGSDQTAPTLTGAPYAGTTGTNACMANAATAAPFSAANAIQGYTDNCAGAVTATLTNTSVTGTDCAWTVTYTFSVKDVCNNTLASQTYSNTGSDQTAPTLTGVPYAGTTGTNSCMANAATAAPFSAANAIQGYSDNCAGAVTATLTNTSVTGTDCAWTVTYTFSVKDICNNTLASQTYSNTGSDQTAPTLTGTPYAGTTGTNACMANAVTAAPFSAANAIQGYSDNCAGVVTATLTNTSVTGTDCAWTVTYTFSVKDVCNNTLASQTYSNTGSDQTAPTLTGTPYAGTTGTNACMANAATAAPFSAANAIQGYSDNCAGAVTATLTNTSVTGTDCAWTVTYTFSVKDVCNNTLASQTYSNTGSDQTAPTLTGTPYTGTTGTNACIANAVTAAPFSAANAIQGYSDNCAGAVTATLTGTAVTGTNCNWTVTYTFSIKDVCNNTLANQTYSNTGSDQTAPVANLTGYTLGNLDGQNGWNGGIGGFTNYSAGDADVVNTVVKNGTQSWYFKKGYNSPGQGSPFSPAVASVGAPGNGSAGNQSVIKLSFKPAALNDGSRITVYEGSVNRDDRTGANLYVQNLPGNLVQLYMFRSDNDGPMNDYTNQEIIGTYPANVWNTVEMVTDYPATNQLDRTTWGTTKYYVNGTLAFTETTWPHWWRFNHSLAYAPGSSIKFTNNNAGAGFYIDDVSMIVNNTISNTTVAGFASGFEPSALPDVLGECCATIPFPPTATDNCAGLITGTTTDPLTYCTQGTHVVTWTYNDGCGNISTQMQNVIIDDNTAPALTGVPYAGTTGTNACMVNAAASAPFSAANAIEGYTDNCGGAVTATLTNTNVSGTDCSWTVTYTFKVTDVNGNELLGQTYSNTGSDQTAPTLTGISYAGTTGTNACMTNAAAAAPFSAANAIQGYTDNCGGAVTATLTNTSVTGTDCAWTVTYTFSVKDVCDNTLASQTYSNTGSDQTAPTLTGAPYAGTTGTNACMANAATAAPFSAANAIQGYTDNCAGAVTATLTNTSVTGTDCAWTVTYTFSVKDVCNNTLASQTYSNTGSDQTAPLATAPTTIDIECGNAAPVGATTYAAFTALGGTASDNCSSTAALTIAYTDGSLVGTNCSGTIARTYTVTDACGNTTTVTQTITVTDNTAPLATAPTTIDIECGNAAPAGVTTYAAFTAIGGTASDNCSSTAVLTIAYTDGSLVGTNCNGTIARTYTVTDACGNTTTVTQTITVTDNTAPVATAPSTIDIECGTAAPAGATTYTAFTTLGGTASDNCTSTAALTIAYTDGSLVGTNCSGTIARTYTVTDACGNTTTVTQTITVTDNTAPLATAPTTIDVECGNAAPVGATTYAAFTALGGTASDNCTSTAALTIAYTDGSLVGTNCSGTIARTYTVTDACGNTTTVTQTITVTDNTAPLATAPTTIDVECGNAAPVGATTYAAFTAIGGTASDNCSSTAVLTIAYTDGSLVGTNCNGTIVRTYTVTDACGNTSTVTQTITVTDNTAPVATAPSTIDIECGTAAPAGATTYTAFTTLGGTASDNCTLGANLTIAYTDGSLVGTDCSGTIARTYTVTDACGNTTTVTQTITVTDNTAPLATAPTIIDIECGNAAPVGATTYAAFTALGGTASDNCTSTAALTIAYTDGSLVGTNCSGAIARTYTVTDACGNTTTVTQTITVTDNTAPLATAPTTIDVECGNAAPIGATTYAAFTALGGTASDNCSSTAALTIAYTDGSLVGGNCSGTIARTYTVTDACSNTTTVTQTITVTDNTAPVATAPSTIDIECGTAAPAGATTYIAFTTLGGTASDNCTLGANLTIAYTDGPLVGTDCSGSIARAYTVTDGCGNAVTVTQTITVSDNTAPALTGTAYAGITGTSVCKAGALAAVSFSATNAVLGYSDNCSSSVTATLTGTNLTGSDCNWTVTYTFSVTDACGNTLSNQTYSNTGGDHTAPSVTCPSNATGIPALGTCSAVVNGINAVYNDNCSTPTLSYTLSGTTVGSSSGQASGLSFNAGLTTVTYSATDACSNVGTCSFSVTVSGCVTVSGNIIWEENSNPVKDVTVKLQTLPTPALVNTALTGAPGTYLLIAGPSGNYRVVPSKSLNLLNGVTAADATVIQQHVVNNPPIVGPYKRIAADVNKSNSITTQDATLITQAIAGNPAALALFNTSWRFVPQAYTFPNPNIPWGFPETIDLTGATGPVTNQNFIGMKIGDVNGTANPLLKPIPPVSWTVNDVVLKENETVSVTMQANRFKDIAAFQMALGFDPGQLEYIGVESNGALNLTDDNFGTFNTKDGEFRAVWSEALGRNLHDGTGVFTVNFKALVSGAKLSDVLSLNEQSLEARAYATDLVETGMSLEFTDAQVSGITGIPTDNRLELLQNRPNPFTDQTSIGFILPADCDAQLRIYNINGRLIMEMNKTYTAGYQQEIINLKGQTGVLYYELTTPFGTLARKMMVTN